MEPEYPEGIVPPLSPDEERVVTAAARRTVDVWDVSPEAVSVYYVDALERIRQVNADIPASTTSSRANQRRLHPARVSRQSSRGVWYALTAAMFCAVGILVGRTDRGWLSLGYRTPSRSTYATTNGQRATITLSDGTVVILGAASRLEVPSDYPSGDRTVRLSGEALVEAVHHDQSPLTVLAGPIAARVLGTTFMVRYYPTDTAAQVAVREGRVAVNQVVVSPSRMLEVSRTGVDRMRVVGTAPFTFAAGVLTLDSVRLANAIPELNRWYDVDIRLGDPALGRRTVEGRFTAGALYNLTEVLEWMFDARVVRDGRVITLFPKAR